MENNQFDLLDQLPCGIFSFSDEGIVTGINATLLNQLGYSKAELVGYKVEKIFTLSTRIFHQTHFFPLLKLQGKANEIFLNLLAKNKEVVPVLVNALQSNNGTSANITCVCITVYERQKYENEILLAKKAAEEALQKNDELQKAKQLLEKGNEELDRQVTQLKYRNNELIQLNDLIAHDLQEPVRKIALFMDMIKKDKDITTNNKTLSWMDNIVKSALRMRNILQSLQEYMLISTDNVVKTDVDLAPLINDQLNKVSEECSYVNFSAEVEDFPVIKANAKQLEILFTQIFKNSFRFASVERNLHIKVSGVVVQENFYNSTDGRYKYVDVIKINIEDNGIGFEEKYGGLIFKLLKKLDPKSQTLGIGLAICKRIAENHGGYITATSSENKGTRITFTLPVD